MARRAILDNGYFLVEDDDATAVVWLRRTATPFPTVEILRSAAAEVERLVAVLPPRRGVVVDAREAPPRNDPEFEAEFARARRPILARFPRVAVLVRSAVGKLQVARYGREDGKHAQLVFEDEKAAVAYLTAAERS